MTTPIAPATAGTSTRPYLIRALHDWCTDNGFTPYIAVFVDEAVQVPKEYVKNNEIVLNVGFEATSALKLGNESIEFKARFGGTSREIVVPIDHVIAIYARENGQGMAFPMPASARPARARGRGRGAPARPARRAAARAWRAAKAARRSRRAPTQPRPMRRRPSRRPSGPRSSGSSSRAYTAGAYSRSRGRDAPA